MKNTVINILLLLFSQIAVAQYADGLYTSPLEVNPSFTYGINRLNFNSKTVPITKEMSLYVANLGIELPSYNNGFSFALKMKALNEKYKDSRVGLNIMSFYMPVSYAIKLSKKKIFQFGVGAKYDIITPISANQNLYNNTQISYTGVLLGGSTVLKTYGEKTNRSWINTGFTISSNDPESKALLFAAAVLQEVNTVSAEADNETIITLNGMYQKITSVTQTKRRKTEKTSYSFQFGYQREVIKKISTLDVSFIGEYHSVYGGIGMSIIHADALQSVRLIPNAVIGYRTEKRLVYVSATSPNIRSLNRIGGDIPSINHGFEFGIQWELSKEQSGQRRVGQVSQSGGKARSNAKRKNRKIVLPNYFFN